MNFGLIAPYEFPGSIKSSFIILLIVVSIWEIIWKGLALWRAAKLNQLHWFVIILIINSAGIIPIIYLLITKKEWRRQNLS